MPDIRDILDALDEADRRLYAQIRTRMRGAYLQALVEVVGIHEHNEHDDYFLDLIDIKVATLFDRGGRFDAVKGKLNSKIADKIEDEIKDEAKIISQGQSVLNAYVGNGQKELKVEHVEKPWPKRETTQ